MLKPILIAEADRGYLEYLADLLRGLGTEVVQCYSKPRLELALNRSPDGAVVVSRSRSPFGLELATLVCVVTVDPAILPSSQRSDPAVLALISSVQQALSPGYMRSRTKGAKVLVLAGSTGAVPVVLELLRRLSLRSTAVVVCQHISAAYSENLRARLAADCQSRVRLIAGSAALEPGVVHLLGGGIDWQLRRRDGGLYIERFAHNTGHFHPSADVFFESLIETRVESLAVVLSGLGADGAQHLTKLKATGGSIAVQDPNDSVASGMPQAAVTTGAVDAVLSRKELAPYLEQRTC